MRKKRKSDSEGFNIWRSYSDMMAGVLLLFVLIMCVTLFQAQKNYDDSIRERGERVEMEQTYTAELEERQKQLDEQAAKLAEQQSRLEEQSSQLAAQQKTLEEQTNQLTEQRSQLTAQQQTLEEQSSQLAAQQKTLEEQNAQLSSQQAALEEKTQLLVAQQEKIDKIIGVKAEVVAALKEEFSQSNLNVNIDENSGAMTLDSSVIFDLDETELKEEGQEILAQVLPVYCSVLIQDKYLPYLAQITIDGYTDSRGEYSYNLLLSQGRALAVAEYLMELMPEFFTSDQIDILMEHLSVNAHSRSNFIYDETGAVDDDASRRVEVKFRLKDEEMIEELNKVLSE